MDDILIIYETDIRSNKLQRIKKCKHFELNIETTYMYDIVFIETNITYEVKELFKHCQIFSFKNEEHLEMLIDEHICNINILIYGSNGWIGKQFIDLLKSKNIRFTEGKSRTDNEHDVLTELVTIKPSHVVSFIGRTHGKGYKTIDYLEQKGKLVENVRDNLYSPFVLATLCREMNIHYTYLGTGCIFNYDGEHRFNENDTPNFFGSSYSVVKGFTDRMMHFYDDTMLNVRIRMPITGENNERNFITKITQYDKICSIPNSMSVLPTLLPYMLKMILRKTTGTINLTNPGVISHNEILTLYKELVDPSFTWNNFTIEEQSKILLSERSNNYLDTTKLVEMFPSVLNIKDAICKVLIDFNRMNLLVTGGCGFIGSNFINYFMTKYTNVNLINIDALYYCANESNVAENIRNDTRYTFVHGNVQDSKLIRNILIDNRVQYVIHFAAQSHVQNSFEDSLTFTNDNILGTHCLLEECRKYGKIKKFIHVSTDEVYGESMLDINENKKTEHSILCPTNPYAATKAGAELLAQSYNHSYKFPIVITRGNNVYGPNQYPEKLIPRFIKLLKENKKVTIQGDGSSVRAFLHVNDTSSAFEKILFNGKIGEIYNIGCDEKMEYSVIEVAKILIEKIQKTNKYEDWIEYTEDRPFNDKRYYISNQKVKDLGWAINTQFCEGLDTII